MMTGEHAVRTSSSATALSVISGPMPAGSPIVTPTRGLALTAIELVSVFAAIHLNHTHCADLVVVSIMFILVHILDVMFEDEQVWPFITMHFDAVLVVPFNGAAQFLIIL